MTNYKMPPDQWPKCPSCEQAIDGLMSRELSTELGRAYVWACPHCLSILGVGHRQGYIAN